MDFTIKVSGKELETILFSLQKQPYESVYVLIAEIIKQAEEQKAKK